MLIESLSHGPGSDPAHQDRNISSEELYIDFLRGANNSGDPNRWMHFAL